MRFTAMLLCLIVAWPVVIANAKSEPRHSAAGRATAGSISNSSQLLLASTAFPDRFLPVSTSRTVTAKEADDPAISWLVYAHTTVGAHYCGQTAIYASVSMKGGFYQDASIALTDQTSFVLAYLGSYYAGAQAAGAAYQTLLASQSADARLCGSSSSTVSSCSGAEVQCEQVTLPGVYQNQNGFSYTMVIRTAVESNSVFEGAFLLGQSTDFSSLAPAGTGYLDSLEAAWQLLVTPLGSPATVSPTPQTTGPAATPSSTSTSAPAPKPTNYQLPRALWPAGWRIVGRYVPSNGDQLFARFHSRGIARFGRIPGLGYVEEAVASAPYYYHVRCRHGPCSKRITEHLSIAYRVSLFPSPTQATSAFQDGARGFRHVASQHLGETLGNQRYAHIFHASQRGWAVLAFSRGRVLVEMIVAEQPDHSHQYLSDSLRLLARLGEWLDSQASTQR